MDLETRGWGIMIGWTIWTIVLPFILEIFGLTESLKSVKNGEYFI